MWRAWYEVKANGGESGIDNLSLRDIETDGVEPFLNELSAQLRAKSYRPKPLKRDYIPKADGKMRPLGMPTIGDRIVQQACRFVMEPLFESLFEDCSYGYRPKRSAKQAIKEVQTTLVRAGIYLMPIYKDSLTIWIMIY